MFPTSKKEILQDTNNAPSAPVTQKRNTRLLIAVLFVSLIISLAGAEFSRRQKSRVQLVDSGPDVVSITPLPATNTVADRVYGTIVFSRDADLITLSLPSRIERTLLGVRSTTPVQLQTAYPPIWSPDGKLLALVDSDAKVIVSEFDTGRYVGTFPLPANGSPESVRISIDPASEILAITQSSTAGSDPVVRFFSLVTQQELGVYPRCLGTGVWMTGIGFAMLCSVDTTQSIVVIRFEPNSSVMTPLARESKNVQYQLIDEYRPGVLLLKRTQGKTVDLMTLDANGKLSIIPKSEYKAVPDIDSIVNATRALAQRIEKEARTKPVLDVSVAEDNSFLLFETIDGLYVARLDLKETPYFLGTGKFARIRPRN